MQCSWKPYGCRCLGAGVNRWLWPASYWCWEANRGSLQEQCQLLTNEPFLQPRFFWSWESQESHLVSSQPPKCWECGCYFFFFFDPTVMKELPLFSHCAQLRRSHGALSFGSPSFSWLRLTAFWGLLLALFPTLCSWLALPLFLSKISFQAVWNLEDDSRFEFFYSDWVLKDGEHPRRNLSSFAHWQVSVQSICGKVSQKYEQNSTLEYLPTPGKVQAGCLKAWMFLL